MHTATLGWFNPAARFDRVTVLHQGTLVLANPDQGKVSALQSVATAGQFTPDLLGGDAKVIPLGAITKVRANRHSDAMNVYYTADGKARMANVGFASSAVRDEAFSALQAQLGPASTTTVSSFTPLRAMVAPLISLAIVSFIVFVAYQSALELAAGAEARIRGRAALLKLLFVGLLNLLGPTGVLILGGLVLLGLVVWLFKRVKTPPIMLTLTPRR